MVPSFATTGNHEYSGSTLSPQWNRAFAWPDNGPQGTGPVYDALKGTAFYTDFQGVRFISMNSNIAAVASALRPEFLDVQTAWLEGLLKNNPNKWTVVTFHHPMFSNEPARNNPTQRNALAADPREVRRRPGPPGPRPLLRPRQRRRGLDDRGRQRHDVRRLGLRPEDVRRRRLQLGRERRPRRAQMLTNTQLYQVISVEGDRMTYKAKTATGRLHDQFTIDKPAGQGKIVTEDLANVQPEGVGGAVPGTLSLDARRGADASARSRPASPRTTRRASPRRSRARRATRR